MTASGEDAGHNTSPQQQRCASRASKNQKRKGKKNINERSGERNREITLTELPNVNTKK
jgi:hypothetical protein